MLAYWINVWERLRSQSILSFVAYFVAWCIVFLLAKPFFVWYNSHISAQVAVSIHDMLEIWWHGLSLDAATAGYLTAFPWLYLWICRWWVQGYRHWVLSLYNGIMAVLCAVIFVADTVLYGFWGFKLDAIIFSYMDNPQAAAASVSQSFIAVCIAIILFSAWAIFRWLQCCTPLITATGHRGGGQLWGGRIGYVLLGGLLFLCIRGGVGRSTSNVGQVYYSANAFLNHGAINPAFNLGYSYTKMHDFSSLGQFFPEAQRTAYYRDIMPATDTLQQGMRERVLTTPRPNIIIILMEGFGAPFVGSLGGNAMVSPNFERLSRQGIYFTQCYANSFRTDRGTVSMLSGYPAFPEVSVMKMPEKTRTLPGIAHTLATQGYSTSVLYGGDINFTNAQSYYRNTGYQQIVSDVDFTPAQRKTHAWGVTDSITMDYLYDMIQARDKVGRPWHIFYQTLASHEPWDVPYHRIPQDTVANAMAYLDHQLGRLITRLQQSEAWNNLLIICMADHSIAYPKGLTEASLMHAHIPMLWLGGAVKGPRTMDKICQQSDLAATLLGQLAVSHRAYPFSRDVLSPSYTYPCALHTWTEGFTFIDSTGYTAFNLTADRPIVAVPHASPRRIDLGKAWLQTNYRDLSRP